MLRLTKSFLDENATALAPARALSEAGKLSLGYTRTAG
jgi:hypothetical protein